ncbi:TadE/TadG family type IV pilus assembly protein [Caulobacter sp.]|uniref:TadE/TadG family type IV pilus assembly protein n=1 Tax=Caulobacter sp. TaxID=78 RepID=UPI003BB0ACF9
MADRARHHRQLLARLGLDRFARADDGAAAIEFAFVGIPFLILVFGLIELGLTFLVSITLENALMTVDRRIRTGDYQNTSRADFSKAVCDEMAWLESSCADSITLDVRVLPAFETAKTLKPPEGVTCFDPGGPRSIMLVRAYYKWPIITPLLQSAVAGGSGVRQVTFASVFVNEPYSPDLQPIKCQ